MRIMITLDFPPQIGGIQRYLEGIVNHRYTDKDLVIVGCTTKKNLQYDKINSCNVTYVSTLLSNVYPKISLVSCFVKLVNYRIIKRQECHVECGNVYAALVPWFISLFVKIPYSVYTYGTELRAVQPDTLKNVLLKKALRNAKSIVAISEYTKNMVHEIYAKANVEIVCPKIESSYIPNVSLLQKRMNMGVNKILCVGRLVDHKGHEVLLDALRLLPPQLFWSMVIVGNGEKLPCLKQQCAQLQLQSKVEFKTNLSDADVKREYETASLFIFPSCVKTGTEGFGIVLLEAMAYRIPVIATRVGGIPEVLDNGNCGMLVEPNNPMAICKSIEQMMWNTDLQIQYTNKAFERLLKNYVWK